MSAPLLGREEILAVPTIEAAYPGMKIPVRVQYLLDEHLGQSRER